MWPRWRLPAATGGVANPGAVRDPLLNPARVGETEAGRAPSVLPRVPPLRGASDRWRPAGHHPNALQTGPGRTSPGKESPHTQVPSALTNQHAQHVEQHEDPPPLHAAPALGSSYDPRHRSQRVPSRPGLGAGSQGREAWPSRTEKGKGGQGRAGQRRAGGAARGGGRTLSPSRPRRGKERRRKEPDGGWVCPAARALWYGGGGGPRHSPPPPGGEAKAQGQRVQGHPKCPGPGGHSGPTRTGASWV